MMMKRPRPQTPIVMAPSMMKIPLIMGQLGQLSRRAQILTTPAVEAAFAPEECENVGEDSREAAGEDR